LNIGIFISLIHFYGAFQIKTNAKQVSPQNYIFNQVNVNFIKHFNQWKSAQRRRKHCVLAVVRRHQKFSPRRRPPSRGRGTAKI